MDIVYTMDNSTTTHCGKCCYDYTEDYYCSIEYCFAVIFCCPCICIDKCGGCKEESKSTPNNTGMCGGVAVGMNGIAVGMMSNQ
jgi:hypothetical protein